MKYKNYEIPNKEIDSLMDKLDISLEEACELYLSDHELVENETVEELTKKAQKNRVTNTIHSAKGEKKDRKPREKKENPLKKQIISHIFDSFFYDNVRKDYPNLEISVRNDEKYIDLTVDGREFTINLVEHRKKKG